MHSFESSALNRDMDFCPAVLVSSESGARRGMEVFVLSDIGKRMTFGRRLAGRLSNIQADQKWL